MFNAYHLADAIPATVTGMVALWAAGSARHWFVRTSVLVAGLLALLLIPAYELVIVFGVEILFVVTGLKIWRNRRLRRNTPDDRQTVSQRRWQVSLQTSMLLTVVVAVTLAVAVSFPALNWFEWMSRTGSGVVAGALTLLCAWLVLGKANRLLRLVAAFVICGAFAVGMSLLEIAGYAIFYWLQSATDVTGWLLQPETREWIWTKSWYWLSTVTIAMPVLCSWLYLMVKGGWYAPFADAAERPGSMRAGLRSAAWARWSAVALWVAAASLPLYLFWRLLSPTPRPAVTTLYPAHYDHLNVAGRMISTTSSQRLIRDDQLSDDELRQELERHGAVFERMRQAFSKSASTGRTVELDDEALSRLMFATLARIELANRLQLTDMQAEASLDWLKLLDLMDEEPEMYYLSLEHIAVQTLWACRTKLSSGQLRDAIQTLAEFESNRKSWDAIVKQLRIEDENRGWNLHLQVILTDWTGYDRYSEQKYDYLLARTTVRMLITELAVLLYQQETGRPPENLENLVPMYIPTLLGDPFGNGSLQYQCTTGSHALYSVGPDGVDDGGQPLSDDQRKGDLVVDQLFLPLRTSQTQKSEPQAANDESE